MTPAAQVLADRWALDEKIDAGAMGEIFRGRHRVLGHTVAIKVMIPDAAREGASTERFLREARIAARLQHPHVVRVEDFGVSDDGRSFLVMELLRGESLAKRLARPPRLEASAVLTIVRQLCEALDAAHAQGIVHRDLKPENIFLCGGDDARPHVKVLDFGVAKFTDVLAEGGHATASNALIGTPKYMSPEQARSSRELDGRSDLWAVGMLVYEMLTGRHPFEGEAIAELLVAILTQKIPPPSACCPTLPPSLDTWTTRALARSRGDRFATGRELADALAEALDGRVGEAWGGDWAPQEAPRRATLRVKRGANRGESEATPETSPSAELIAPSTQRDPRRESVELRSSWRNGLLAGLVAASAIFALSRVQGGARSDTTRDAPMLAVPIPMAAQGERAPPPARSVAQPAAEPATLAHDASVAPSLAAPEARAIEAGPRPRRHHRRHRRERSGDRVEPAAAPGDGIYDPTGI